MIPKAIKPGMSAALIMTVLAFSYEGVRLNAFADIATGEPTICLGHTKGVKFGDKLTYDQCVMLQKQDGSKYEAYVRRIVGKQPETRIGGLGDFCYNLGEAGCRKVLDRIAAGYVKHGCETILLYECAGLKKGQRCTDDRKLPGLVKRRMTENELCLMEPADDHPPL